MVSYRQWNMMDEYVLMDDVKEKLCYVAGSAADELKRAKVRGASNEVNREYVLPDGVHVLRGYVKEGPARDPDAESSDDDDDDDGGGGGKRRRKKKQGGGEKRRKGAAGRVSWSSAWEWATNGSWCPRRCSNRRTSASIRLASRRLSRRRCGPSRRI